MARGVPMFATDATAAKQLDMPVRQFRELVAAGILPPPVRVGEFERWDMEAMQSILRGNIPRQQEALDL